MHCIRYASRAGRSRKAVLFLIGTEMDYKTDKLSAQFVFNNPNQTSACGCGESVKLKPAAQAN